MRVFSVLVLVGGIVLCQAVAAEESTSATTSTATSDQPSSAEALAARQEFDKALQPWKRLAGHMQELHVRFLASNPENRKVVRQEYGEVLAESERVLHELMPVLKRAYTANPTDPELMDFMSTIAILNFDGDKFDDALDLAECLIANNFPKPEVYDLAGLAAHELDRLDDAEKYLRIAAEKNALSSYGRELLAELPNYRAVVEAEMARRAASDEKGDLPRVRLHTTRGDIVLELFEDDAPNTVASFLGLVADGFYDGLNFHRVVSAFGAMSGSPTNDGQGGPGYETLFEGNSAQPLPHLRGTVSMVPLTKRTNGSQFFITLRPSRAAGLNGKQTVFARVIEGMDVVTRLHRFDTVEPNSLFEPDRILEATIIRRRSHRYDALTTADIAQEKSAQGIAMFQQQKFSEASKLFREGLDLLPTHHALHFNLAACLLNERKFDEAEKQLRETLRLNAKHAKAHHFLGIILNTRGQKEEAISHFREALRIDPTSKPAREALQAIEGS
ncbi:MAG: peptidylprolyl isomerase [Pirellulales bacterium]|nr:peptidylprolyl isomerase [Pirellulales bacterium]